MTGIEKLRSACDATQIQPEMKAGISNGRTMWRRIDTHFAPEVLPASSISPEICASAPFIVRLPNEM